MKITFEGDLNHVIDEMRAAIAVLNYGPNKALKNISPDVSEKPSPIAVPTVEVQGPGPEAKPLDELLNDPPVDKPKASVEKPVDKMAKVRAAKKAKAPPSKTVEELIAQVEAEAEAEAAAPPMDPAEVVKVRQKTIEDLQAAYAGGHQKEVFELLSRFGNGAKSFRELPPDAFVPIRKAIDNGALT